MTEDADTKAKRRRRIRESFVPPLNEIALRHVDSVQALTEVQRGILVQILPKIGFHRLGECLIAFKRSDLMIGNENHLIQWLQRSDHSQLDGDSSLNETPKSNSKDSGYLAGLLIQCYPDMPSASAEALVASEVMSACLHVVAATRRALEDAKSDFVITALYTLFEERLNAIKQLINRNPAFVKAIERSRPDWKIKN